ncbi:MAG: acyl carrier protein [Planctomycetes bacterium]|nr:acyl carrier protein [Planctomycetota bacterium]
MRSASELLADLAEVVRQTFPDRDLPEPVEPSTRVFGDLGLASIEIVVLAERLDAYFGRRLPFGTFLKGLRDRGAEDLSVGELVAFLQQHTG